MPDIVDIVVKHAVRSKHVLSKIEARLRLVSKVWCASVDPYIVTQFHIGQFGLERPVFCQPNYDLPAILKRNSKLCGYVLEIQFRAPSRLEHSALSNLARAVNLSSLGLSRQALDVVAEAFEKSPFSLPKLVRLKLALVPASGEEVATRRKFLSSLSTVNWLDILTEGADFYRYRSGARPTLEQYGLVSLLEGKLLSANFLDLNIEDLAPCTEGELAAILLDRSSLVSLTLGLGPFVRVATLLDMLPLSLTQLSLMCGGPQATDVLVALADPSKLPNLKEAPHIRATTPRMGSDISDEDDDDEEWVLPIPNALELVRDAFRGLQRRPQMELIKQRKDVYCLLANRLAGKLEYDPYGFGW